MESGELNTTAKASMPNAAKRALANPKMFKSFPGWMIVLGADTDSHLFIGWAQEGGVNDLITRVQFGSPRKMRVLHFFAADAPTVAGHQAMLVNYKCPGAGANWFLRRPIVEYHFEDLRDAVYADDAPKKACASKRKPARKSKGNKRRRQRSN